MRRFNVGDVVQFKKKHKWAGCFGYIHQVKQCCGDEKYMVGVPVPERGTAYIFTMYSAGEIEYIGKAVLMPTDEEDDDDYD